jgi:hypothetical protein
MRPTVAALVILALLFFILAAAVGGGMVSMSDSGWLLPGGLASLTLAWLLSLLP